MSLRFDHLGVVVAEIAKGRDHFRSVFNIEHWTEQFTDPFNLVHVQFGQSTDGICYELISPLGPDSPILRALKTGNPILNHIAYLTPDLDLSARYLRENGYMPAGDARPAIAYEGKRIQFFVSPLRFIVELIEAFEHRHNFHLQLPKS